MANISRKTEANTLEQTRVALENAKNQPIIAEELAELGYGEEKIAEGEQILADTRTLFDFKIQEDQETTDASVIFKKEKEFLDDLYKKQRKKAKALFREEAEVLKRLGVEGQTPRAFTNWLETVRKFYTNATDEILGRLAPIKVTQQDITTGLEQIKVVETARAEYLREVGESQDATKQKDAAFAKIDKWMQQFYAVADIALEDHPQLMEALSRKRKS